MKTRLLYLLALLLVLARPAAAGYSTLVVLGDSLSDMGNAAILSGGAFPGTPNGRASNGPVAAEYLAGYLGITNFAPSLAGGTNYAVLGAMTDSGNFNAIVDQPTGVSMIPGLLTTGMSVQRAQAAAAGPYDPATTLFMIWGGPNDIFLADALGQNVLVAAQDAVTNLAGMIGDLLGIGAQNFLVVGMPDLGITPEAIDRGPAVQAGLSAVSQGFNSGLAGAVNQLVQLTGANIRFFDTIAALAPIQQNPAAFGITNTTDRCIDSPSALATNCAGYAFADGVHPTTAVHSYLSARMVDRLPEPATAWLLVPLAGAAWFGARRRSAARA